MKVIYKVNVIGRGYILVVKPQETINITDEIIFNDFHFKISGIERLSNMKKIGLQLSPNDMVGKLINVGDEIEVKKV